MVSSHLNYSHGPRHTPRPSIIFRKETMCCIQIYLYLILCIGYKHASVEGKLGTD